MTDGESEIVLMSNFAASEKASVIVDGNNNEWTQADQLFNIRFKITLDNFQKKIV